MKHLLYFLSMWTLLGVGCVNIPSFTPGQLGIGGRDGDAPLAGSDVGMDEGDEIFDGRNASGSAGQSSNRTGPPTAGEPMDAAQQAGSTSSFPAGGHANTAGDQTAGGGMAASVGGTAPPDDEFIVDPGRLTLEGSRLTGVAPLAIFFKAKSGPQDALSDGEFVDYRWAIQGEEIRSGTGSFYGYVFHRPGAYQVMVLATTRSGEVVSATVSVTVDDPDTVFPEERTACLALAPDFENCPAGASNYLIDDSNPFRSTLRTLLRNSRRILLRRGDQFNLEQVIQLQALGNPGPIYLGAFPRADEGNLPASLPEIVAPDGVFKLGSASDIRIIDWSIHVESQNPLVRAIETDVDTAFLLIHQVRFTGNRPALFGDGGTFKAAVLSGLELSNSSCIRVRGEDLSLIKSTYIADGTPVSDDCEALITLVAAGPILLDNNLISSPLGRGASRHIRLDLPNEGCQRRAVLSHNRLIATHSGDALPDQQSFTFIDMRPSTAMPGENVEAHRCRNQVLVHGNFFGMQLADLRDSLLTIAGLIIENAGVTIVNNLFTFGEVIEGQFQQAILPFIRLRRPQGPLGGTSGGHEVTHNTFYARKGNAGVDPGLTAVIIDDAGIQETRILSNVFVGHKWLDLPAVLDAPDDQPEIEATDNIVTAEMVLGDGTAVLSNDAAASDFMIRTGAAVPEVNQRPQVIRDLFGQCRNNPTLPGAFSAEDRARSTASCRAVQSSAIPPSP
ncbi:MAG: hypothetical protein VX589_17930 [Myxococcota bacterium]|nr:hypothetical protein [Myxococcota bacterium]